MKLQHRELYNQNVRYTLVNQLSQYELVVDLILLTIKLAFKLLLVITRTTGLLNDCKNNFDYTLFINIE